MKKYALSEDFRPLTKEEVEAVFKVSTDKVDTSVATTSDEPLDNTDR